MTIFNTVSLDGILRTITSCLRYPVIVVLIILMILTVFLTGSLIAEAISEHRHLKVHMPSLVDDLKNEEIPTEECIAGSGLLKRQKKLLTELTCHPDLTDNMREALALRLLEDEQERLERVTKFSDMLAKLGPILGLLGTLIPLGPGIVALGQGDTYTLSQSLLTAFDTTVVGLITAAVAMVISAIRKTWYGKYMSIMEALVDCVLEVEKKDDSRS